MADDDLERFAQGLSAAGSYQPVRPAVSVASPSASPDPDMFARMIAQGNTRLEEIKQMSGWGRFFGGNLEKSEIMDRLPKLEAMRRGIVAEELKAQTEARQVENQRFHQESESRKFLLEKFDKLYGMPPEQRAAAGPIYAEVIGDLLGRSSTKNAEVLKPLITKVFTNPDLGKQLRDIFDDPAFEPDLPGLTALFATQEVSKWPELREKAVEKAQKRWDALVASNLKTLVDETRQELGKTSVNAQDLIASAQRRFGAFAKSPIVQQAFIGRINSLTPEQQIELGMVPGKIALGAQQKAADVLALAEPKVAAAAAYTAGEIKGAEEAAKPDKGEKLGVTFNRFAQQLFPGTDPNKLTGPQTAQVNAAVEQAAGNVSALQGSAGVAATHAERRKWSILETMPGYHIVDKKTGQFVDRTGMSQDRLTSEGGEKKYAVLDRDETKAYRGVVEAKVLTRRYADIAQQLTKKAGLNLAQRFGTAAQTLLGIENVGVDLDAMRGSVLRLAGTFQGSRVQLSDNDVKAVAGMIPTVGDTTGTAMQRLRNVDLILSTMQKVALGEVPNNTLTSLIEQHAIPKLKGNAKPGS